MAKDKCGCGSPDTTGTIPASRSPNPSTPTTSGPIPIVPATVGAPDAPACSCCSPDTPAAPAAGSKPATHIRNPTPISAPASCSCGPSTVPRAKTPAPISALPMAPSQAACCGPGPIPPLGSYAPPGTDHPHLVAGWLDTPPRVQSGRVPLVRTVLTRRDRLGTLLARLGATRNNYTVAPGLYGVGAPGPDSPVLVSANYKLSFDALRKELGGLDAWLLVLDTRGVNVWCAAGKKTFSTDEVVRMVRGTGLERLVSHRTLVLPQLAATGVSALAVRKACGFSVAWGPVRASDLPQYLRVGRQATEPMRRVTFTLTERAVLVPVEFWVLRKAALRTLLALAVLAGLARLLLPLPTALAWAGSMGLGLALGALAGGLLIPLLLPWLPGRSFWIKGLATGLMVELAACLAVGFLLAGPMGWGAGLAGLALSSWMAMNFTGATPFTSPSGVEKEMRRGIPAQLALALAGLGLWLAGPFA